MVFGFSLSIQALLLNSSIVKSPPKCVRLCLFGAGLICPAEDHKALAARIIQFFNMSESERDMFGNNSKRYFLENYEMHQQCEKLIEILQQKIELKRQKNRH